MSARIASLVILAFFVVGCAPPRGAPTPSVAPTDAPLPVSSPVASVATATSSPLPTPDSSPTPTLAPVTVAAVKGNLFIRRGPDVAFNPIAVLSAGQRETALARDVLAEWVEIRVPSNPGQTGWVSLQTTYSAVTGDVTSLPEIQPTDWPVPAFLRNCTFHDMTAEPGGILLPAVTNFPDNDVRIPPGTYRVYDTDVDGYPEVLKVELREGSAVDIRVDGNGFKKKCPEP